MLELDGLRPNSDLELRPTGVEELDAAAAWLGMPAAAVAAASPAAMVDALIGTTVPAGGRLALALPEDPAVAHAVVRLGRHYVDVGRSHDLRVDMAALRFVLGDQPIGLVWLGDPAGPCAVGIPSEQLARLAARGAPLLVDRRQAADGGCRREGLSVDGGLVLLSPPSASPARSGVLLVGPESVVGAVRRVLPQDCLLPPLVESFEQAARAARRSSTSVRAFVEALSEVRGLLVGHGRAAYVCVRLPGCSAADLLHGLADRDVRVAAFPGPRTRESVRIRAPHRAEERDVVVRALEEIAAAT